MKIYFSPGKRGFYHEGIQTDIPEDCVEITTELYKEFQSNMSEGKDWEFSGGNFLFFKKSTPLAEASVERSWRNYELRRADIEIQKLQDGNKSGISLSDWRAYRNQLRGWPQSENFPSSEYRPTPPDYKRNK